MHVTYRGDKDTNNDLRQSEDEIRQTEETRTRKQKKKTTSTKANE